MSKDEATEVAAKKLGELREESDSIRVAGADEPQPDELDDDVSAEASEDEPEPQMDLPADEDDDDDDDEPSAEQSDDTEPEDEFDDELLDLAQSFGLSERQARSFSSPRDLEKHLWMKGLEQTGQSTQKAAETVAAESRKKAIEIGDDDDFETAVIEKLNAALDDVNNKISVTQQQLQQANAAMVVARVDALLERHGDAFRDEIGEGSMFDMEPTSRTFKNRSQLIEELVAITEIAHSRGRNPGSESKMVINALNNLFGAKAEKRARKNLQSKVDKRKASFSSRPAKTTKTQKAPTTMREARLAAEERVREALKEMNL